VEFSRPRPGRTKDLCDESDLVDRDILGVSESGDYSLLDGLSKGLRQIALLVISMEQIAKLLAAEGRKCGLHSWE
jgi:hypothetical protein